MPPATAVKVFPPGSTAVYQWSAAASNMVTGAVGCFWPTSEPLVSNKFPFCADAIVRFVFAAGLEASAKFRAEPGPNPLLRTGFWL